jgi:hypothetical protein
MSNLTKAELDNIRYNQPTACGDPTCDPEKRRIMTVARNTIQLVNEFEAMLTIVSETTAHADRIELPRDKLYALAVGFKRIRSMLEES